MSDFARCKGPTCRTEVRWVDYDKYDRAKETTVRSRLLINVAPSETGNIAVLGGVAVLCNATRAAELRAAGQQLYESHWATCSDAAYFRARKQGGS